MGILEFSDFAFSQKASKSVGKVVVGFMSSGANAAVAYPLYVLSSCLVHTRQRINPGIFMVLPLIVSSPFFNFTLSFFSGGIMSYESS